ncbi:MAG: hypothetical protein N2691_06030 [Patescibacteria group bacterium]|nr:hypothetical protein [Patescibacteria group bacterium]
MKNQFQSVPMAGHQSGMIVITVVVFMMVAILITTAATLTTVVNTRNTTLYEYGTRAYAMAESGAENALLTLLRNPGYTGETLTLDGGTVTVSVTRAGSNRTITSTSNLDTFTRSVQVEVTYINNVMTITSWREVY